MLPKPPNKIDGASLSTSQADWLKSVVVSIYSVGQTRSPASILDQAILCFRKAHERKGKQWVRRPVVQIGGPGGVAFAQPE